MAEQYSVEAFLKANNTGFIDSFRAAAAAARAFSDQLENTDIDTSGVERAGKQFEQVGTRMNKQGKNIAKTGGIITAAITLPLLGAAAAAINTGMDFEKSMSNVQAISGATGDDLLDLEKKAREMGAGTSKSAGEAADAMSYMALAGWDSMQIMAGIEPVLRLSEAGSMDLARASDLVTDSMSALGVEVKDLPGFLDQVAQTSRKANTNMDALMSAFLAVGGTFNNLNVPLAEGNALLGIMANRGIKGSEAGNSLNSILVNLTSGAGQAGAAMSQLGVSAFDSKGNFKGVENVLLEVMEATEGLTEEQRTQALSMIAGKTQLAGFQALLDGLGNEYGDLKGDIEESNGALGEMASIMQDNLKGKLTEIGSALSEVGIKIYQHLLPYLSKAAEMFLALVNKVNALSPKMQVLIGIFAAVAAAIGPLLVVFGTVIAIVGSIITNFGVLTTKFAPLIAKNAALKAGVSLLGRAFAALLGPVGIAIAVILTLIPIFKSLYEKNEKFRQVVDATWAAVKEAIAIAVAFITNVVQTVIGALVEWWQANQDTFLAKASTVWATILTVVTTYLAFLRDTVMTIVGKVQDFWAEHGAFISEIAEIAWRFISTTVTLHIKNVWAVIQLVMGYIKGLFQIFWPIISGVVQVAWALIKSIVEIGINWVFGILDVTMKLIKGDWEGAWESIKETASSIMESIVSTFEDIDLVQIGKDIINGLIKGITSIASSAVEAVSNIAGNMISAARKVLDTHSPSRVFTEIGEFVSVGLANGINDKAKQAVKSVESMAGNLTRAFNPNLALASTDYNAQMRGLNGQIRNDMNAKVSSELNVNRQSARINLSLGGTNFTAFVDDISSEQALISRLERGR